MKSMIFILCGAFAACGADVKLDTPVTDAKVIFATYRNERAANCAVSNKGVTATYLNPDASFHLRYDQFAVIELNGKTTLTDAAVFQIAKGTFVAEMRNGDFVRVNTVQGTTTASIGGVSYNFTRQPTP